MPSTTGSTSRLGCVNCSRSLCVFPACTLRESRFVIWIREFLSYHNSLAVTPTVSSAQYLSSHLMKQLPPPSGPYSTNPKVSMVENTSLRHDTYL